VVGRQRQRAAALRPEQAAPRRSARLRQSA
jgi:hypothetical protein